MTDWICDSAALAAMGVALVAVASLWALTA